MESVIKIPTPRTKKEIRMELLDGLNVGDFFPIPESDVGSWSPFITEKYHDHSDKRFKVTKKEAPAGQARIWRIK